MAVFKRYSWIGRRGEFAHYFLSVHRHSWYSGGRFGCGQRKRVRVGWRNERGEERTGWTRNASERPGEEALLQCSAISWTFSAGWFLYNNDRSLVCVLGTRVKSRSVSTNAQYGHNERKPTTTKGDTGRRRTCVVYIRSLSETLLTTSLLPSTDPHCRFPACRTHGNHITGRASQKYACGCQISRRETHVTGIKFILTAILLRNLSFVPWFCSHWSTARSHPTAGQSSGSPFNDRALQGYAIVSSLELRVLRLDQLTYELKSLSNFDQSAYINFIGDLESYEWLWKERT